MAEVLAFVLYFVAMLGIGVFFFVKSTSNDEKDYFSRAPRIVDKIGSTLNDVNKNLGKSNKDKNKVKKFKNLIDTTWGENEINPKNSKETQPLYYEDKFKELLEIVQA